MALFLYTEAPNELLMSFLCREEHRLNWAPDSAGNFVHLSQRWKYEAWMKPVVEPHRLAFYAMWNPERVATKAAYAAYHALLAESFISFHDDAFDWAEVTAKLHKRDEVPPTPAFPDHLTLPSRRKER